MTLADLTDPAAVHAALDRFDHVGREAFLAEYGFGQARRYFVRRNNNYYDSKAIAAVAHGIQHPGRGVLTSEEFSGGEHTVKRRLELLGFQVVSDVSPSARRYWAFQSSPSGYRIEDAVRELKRDAWTTKRSKVSTGDLVILWKSGGSAQQVGIVAFGEVESDPIPMTAAETGSLDYWVKPPDPDVPEPRVWVRYISTPALPLWVGGPHDEALQRLTVNGNQGTVFVVQPEQWTDLTERAGLDSEEASEARRVLDAVEEIVQGHHRGSASSAVERRVVERRAMQVATEYFSQDGWIVRDVSRNRSYDLLCQREGSPDLHVEVKGTRGEGDEVVLTRNEVEHASTSHPNVALVVVSGITLETPGEAPVAVGGVASVILPWGIDRARLTPIAYSYLVQ